MSVTRVRVRRERPTALAWAIALCVTMLVVYVLTLSAARPDVVESVSAAPRVTSEIELPPLEGWCVTMAQCDAPEEARLQAAAYSARGAAGYVARLEDAWQVLGAVYDSKGEAERIAERLSREAGLEAGVIHLEADRLKLRITASEAQIEAIAGADATLREQARQLGQIALQLDRGELGGDAARTLCAVAATEAEQAAGALESLPGENRLCAALADQLRSLAAMQRTLADSRSEAGATLSGMARCAQIAGFLGQWEFQRGLKGQ